MYKHGIPEHCDERAYKFFHRVYVGKCDGKHGEDEHGHKMSWDSRHEELKPSTTYGQLYCVYCGKRPYAIQPDGFHVTGYVCVCTVAMNEVDTNNLIEEMEERHTQEMHTLALKLPKPSNDVKRKIIEHKLKDDYYLNDVLKALRVD